MALSAQGWLPTVTEDKDSELQAPAPSVPHLIAREYELGRGRTAGEETGRPSLGLWKGAM